MAEQDILYHRERAQAELDLAYRAEGSAAAQSHLRLAGLHMERLKRQDERCCGSSLGHG